MDTKIIREIDEVKFGIEQCKITTDYTLFLEHNNLKKYVMSRYDSKKDVSSRVSLDKVNKETMWILIGFQYGYGIEVIKELCGNDSNIIIIEPTKELYEIQIKHNPSFDIQEYSNLEVVYGTDWEELKRLLIRKLDLVNSFNI